MSSLNWTTQCFTYGNIPKWLLEVKNLQIKFKHANEQLAKLHLKLDNLDLKSCGSDFSCTSTNRTISVSMTKKNNYHTLHFLADWKKCVAGWLHTTTQNYALLKSSLKSYKLFYVFAMETPAKWIFPLFELPRGGGEYFLEIVKRTSILKQALTGIYQWQMSQGCQK